MSPCWSALSSNKENINLENMVSFKNIVNAKKQQSRRHDISPHCLDGYASIFTPTCRHLDFAETGTNSITKWSRKKVETRDSGINGQLAEEDETARTAKGSKNELEVRDILKSKDKQISTLHSQVKVL